MAKTIHYTPEDIKQYARTTDILQFSDLEVIGEEYNIDTNTIYFKCKHSCFIGVCPDCGQISNKIHDYPEEREVYDAPIRGCYVKLVFNSMRLKCGFCNKPFTLPVADVVPNCTYTYRLADIISDPARKQDIMTLSRIYGIGYKTAERIIFKAVENKLEERATEPIKVKRLGIDEIRRHACVANKKGNGDYVLVLTDLDRRVLLDILPDRTKISLENWLRKPPSGIDLSELSEAATDLWFHYKDTVLEVFSHVNVVADRFHVMQNLHKVIDEERRKAQNEAKTKEESKKLKGLRYILLKDKSKLSQKELERLEKLAQSHPKLYKLYYLRQELHDFYEERMSPRAAKKDLNKWIKRAKRLQLESLNKFCKTLQNWKKQIIGFFASRTTSGFVEGMNNKIRFFKRVAFGLPNFNHFRLRMLWVCG